MSTLLARLRLSPYLLLISTIWSLIGAPVAQAKSLKIPGGTTVIVALASSITSDLAPPGTTVPLRVVSDVVVDGKVLIAAGAAGTASVNSSQKANYAGIPGKLTLSAVSVTAVDGNQVPLTGLTYREGENKMVISIGLALVCLLTLLIKGGPAELSANSQFTATVPGQVEVNVP